MQNTKAPPGKEVAAKRDSAPAPAKMNSAKPKASHPRKDGLAKYAREVGAWLK